MMPNHQRRPFAQISELDRARSIPHESDNATFEHGEDRWVGRTQLNGVQLATKQLDTILGGNPNVLVFHEIRIEHEGEVAAIDHLIVSRLMECHVIDSKLASAEVRIADDGVFEIRTPQGWRRQPSPTAQNAHNIRVLQNFLRDSNVIPRHWGISRNFEFLNWVLISPGTKLRRKAPGIECVVKATQLSNRFADQNLQIEKFGLISSILNLLSLRDVERVSAAFRGANVSQSNGAADRTSSAQKQKVRSNVRPKSLHQGTDMPHEKAA